MGALRLCSGLKRTKWRPDHLSGNRHPQCGLLHTPDYPHPDAVGWRANDCVLWSLLIYFPVPEHKNAGDAVLSGSVPCWHHWYMVGPTKRYVWPTGVPLGLVLLYSHLDAVDVCGDRQQRWKYSKGHQQCCFPDRLLSRQLHRAVLLHYGSGTKVRLGHGHDALLYRGPGAIDK